MISRSPPSVRYNGLCILLDNPSRFDLSASQPKLCSGPAQRLLEDAFSTTRYGRLGLDIRTLECKEPLLLGTKVVLLAGERAALSQGIIPERFHAMRGAPFERDGIVYIPTYAPQDSCDVFAPHEANFHARLNQQPNETPQTETDSDTEDNEYDTKSYGKTARRNYYTWCKLDIRKACRILESGIHRGSAQISLLFRPEEATASLRSIVSQHTIYVDIETDPLSGRIIAIGYATSAAQVFSCALQPRMLGGLESTTGLVLFYQEFIAALARAKQVVAHNAQFDLWILAWLYKIPPPAQERIFDTMLAQHRLFPGLEKSLGHCISLYTDEPYHKDEAIFTPHTHEQLAQLLTYNAKDIYTMAMIHEAQLKLAATIPGASESIAQSCALVRPLLLKSLRGMTVNTTLMCSEIDAHRTKAEFIESKILPVLTKRAFNVRSVKQVSSLLYDEWHLPKPTGKNASLTGKTTLYNLALKHPLPTLKAIIAARMEHHDASQLSFKLWREDRLTSQLVDTTDSFRLHSRKLFGQWGSNVQNFPKNLRKIVIAKPGHKLIQVDQRNAEALIVAYLVKSETKYRQLLLSGFKLHTYVSLFLFKNVWDRLMGEDCERFMRAKVSELWQQPRVKELDLLIRASDNNEASTRYYYMGKQTGLSANYDIGASEFSRNALVKSNGQVYIPHKDADKFLSVYHNELFPEIRTQFHSYVKECNQNGVLRNFFGFPRVLQEHPQMRLEPKYLKMCYAWIPQSTVGTLTNIADSTMQAKLDCGELKGFEILTNTHDSLLVHAPEDRIIEVAQIVQQHMNQTLANPWGESFQMGTDVAVGSDWGNVKGMK